MSGIFAMVALGNKPEKPMESQGNISINALESLKHRGDDQQDIWLSEQGNIALGQTYLNTCSPPNIPKDRIIMNGEFYHDQEIKNKLTNGPASINLNTLNLTSSEMLLAFYQAYGTEALRYLRGEFAFCLWDEKAQVLFAARDRFGIKPLYYTVKSGYLYLASEIKALLATKMVTARWNDQAYTTRAFYLGDETLFENIYQIPSGCYLLLNNGRIKIEKYWDMNYPKENYINSSNTLSEQEYILKIRNSFEEAVKIRMRSQENLGFYLSGGIDSSAVLAIAKKYCAKPLETFTLSFSSKNNTDTSEKYLAKLSADYMGVSFNSVSVCEQDIVDYFETAIWHSETPFFNGHGVAKYLLSKAAHQAGVSSVLTGQGADEIFAGYPHYQRDMALYGNVSKTDGDYQDYLKLEKEFIAHEKNNDAIDDRLFPIVKNTLGFIPSWMESQAQWAETLSNFLNPHYLNNLKNYHPYQYFMLNQAASEQIFERHPVHQSMYLWAKSYLPNFVLKTLGDRMEMANAVSARVAFLDHKLVELANQIPVNIKLKPSTTKYILREALKPYLPEEIYQRKKYYFRAPQALLTPNGKLYNYIRDTLNSQEFRKIPFFDHAKIIHFLDNVPKLSVLEHSHYDGILMELLSLTLIQKLFNPV